MKFITLIWFLSSSGHANMDPVFIKKLHAARTGQQVAQLHTQWLHFRVLKKACEIELRQSHVPISCYSALDIEAKWLSLTKRRKSQLTSHLDNRCQQAAQDLHLPAQSVNLGNLSQKCKNAVEEGWENQNYRAKLPPDWSET